MNMNNVNINDDYNVILRYRNGRYFLYIPELQIAVADHDLTIAYQKIEKMKKELIENLTEGDFVIPKPKQKHNKGIYIKHITKALISLSIISFVIGSLLIGLYYRGTVALTQGKHLIMQEVVGIKQLADDWVASDQKNNFAKTKGMVKKYKPVIDQIKQIFADEPVKNNPKKDVSSGKIDDN